MKNSKKVNRNHWSQDELVTLHQCVEQAKKKTVGLANAAKKLGRTYGACMFKYYRADKPVQGTNKVLSTSTLTFKIKSWSIEDGNLKVEIYKEA